jgi:hypothetical protein
VLWSTPKLSQSDDIRFFDFPTLLNESQYLKWYLVLRNVGRPTCSQSAMSLLTLEMEANRSLKTVAACSGERVAYLCRQSLCESHIWRFELTRSVGYSVLVSMVSKHVTRSSAD